MTSAETVATTPEPAAPVRTSRAARSGVPRYVRPPATRVLALPAGVWRLILIIAFFGGVEILAQSGAVPRLSLVPVSEMAVQAGELLTDTDFLVNDLLRSAGIVVVSFVVASGLGVAVAYLMWRSAVVRSALEPYLSVFYAVPTFAVYPILVVLFGVGVWPIVVLASTFSIVVVILNSLAGFDSVPEVVSKLDRSLKLTRWQSFRLILLPSAMPDIAAGVKLCMAYSVIATLAMEFILASDGLGNFIADAYDSFAVAEMYGAILIVGALALIANLGISAALNRLDWRRR
ncbi:ABC transporter permease [Mycolicibacterium smegmatis]|uniref:ABC nitrate/sulfonate/bicarbonate family protein transporter, inner membrane subunit n=3 Tax=Mycolicibacterium smegmatis TaxID=1772 RepID=A0QVA2_MYCS2|nr:ABC transporter permease [Mycolicibacterium smegmatis]ABK70043.1 ABC nitrate/sulfonate/bicarbonate family protein transporter, inner membrane subunit [Mycolicibacterium smegmatis MC2 155]AFP38909.1 Binding-protein-dependent transport systems inner membrane component [Mycolicibacterium smegmatis MC2 155]AIU07682.1 nitrate ABC transporter permease [Mycolicibacterium smegmatis MC2 155]AIU14307.1 nitrate ABC transporter permease [Mycolicibacterium smegmatis]AIU20930.1 nitrate ABC transporter pe